MTDITTHESSACDVLGFLAAKTKNEWTVNRDLFIADGLSSLFTMKLMVCVVRILRIMTLGTVVECPAGDRLTA